MCVRRCDVCVIDVFLCICHCTYMGLCWCFLVYCSMIARVIDDILTEGNLKASGACVCICVKDVIYVFAGICQCMCWFI